MAGLRTPRKDLSGRTPRCCCGFVNLLMGLSFYHNRRLFPLLFIISIKMFYHRFFFHFLSSSPSFTPHCTFFHHHHPTASGCSPIRQPHPRLQQQLRQHLATLVGQGSQQLQPQVLCVTLNDHSFFIATLTTRHQNNIFNILTVSVLIKSIVFLKTLRQTIQSPFSGI